MRDPDPTAGMPNMPRYVIERDSGLYRLVDKWRGGAVVAQHGETKPTDAELRDDLAKYAERLACLKDR